MKTIPTLAALALGASMGALSAADAPQLINYQGKLLNSSGNAVADGAYSITFKLYGAPSGSSFLWGESDTVTVTGGVLNVLLGGGAAVGGGSYGAIGDALSSTTTSYLGLTVTADTSGTVSSPQEITPRMQLLSSAYALVAHTAHSADSAASATNAMQLGGQNASAYFIPASSAAVSVSGPVTFNNATTTAGGLTAAGASTFNGSVALNGSVAIGSGVTTTGGGWVPQGGIIMWSGSTVPSGWHLCDGAAGTPDLRNRFVIGGGSSYANGSTGGSSSVTLTSGQLPDHRHQYKDTVWGENNINWNSSGQNGNGPDGLGTGVDGGNNYVGSKSGWDNDNSLAWVYRWSLYANSGGTSPAGQSSVSILPPYYALAFIQRIN